MNYIKAVKFNLLNIIELVCIFITICEAELKVSGRCGRPALPPKARLHQISPEMNRFDNNQKVTVVCEKDQFPHKVEELKCKNGMWSGKTPRCGKHVDAQVIHFEIFDCNSPDNRRLLSQPINQSDDAPADLPRLPPNSFHINRLPEDIGISSDESSCYTWKIKFNKKIKITFLLIDVTLINSNGSQQLPILRPVVSRYRTCSLQNIHKEVIDSDEVAGYYYYCDLNNDHMFAEDVSDLMDSITVHINATNKRHIGLEAVFIGDIYSKTLSNNEVKPDCGELELKNVGVNLINERDHMSVLCNDSFFDNNRLGIKYFNPRGNSKHQFECNASGQWVGHWPICEPILSCPKIEIIDEMDNTIAIEEIGNVYYMNESKWFAINDSWVRYICKYEKDLIIGKDFRICMKNGHWSNKLPTCISTSSGISGYAIAGILFAVLITFIAILSVVLKKHSNRVNMKLRANQMEMEEKHRKRVSDEYYADVIDENYYSNTNLDENNYYDNTYSDDVDRKLSIDYMTMKLKEQPRYMTIPKNGASNGQQADYMNMTADI